MRLDGVFEKGHENFNTDRKITKKVHRYITVCGFVEIQRTRGGSLSSGVVTELGTMSLIVNATDRYIRIAL